MKVCPAKSLLLCFALTAAGANVALSAVGVEPIRFSRPAIPIAVELKEEQQIPQGHDKSPDFGASSIQQPMAVPPMMVRTPPRGKGKDSGAAKHWLLRGLEKSSDATDRANAREKLTDNNTRSRDPSFRERDTNDRELSEEDSALERNGKKRGLSPNDYHWDARRDDIRTNSWSSTGRNSSEQKGALGSNPFGPTFTRDGSAEQNRDSGSSFFSDPFGARPKEEKVTEAQLERRAAFERLLNNSAVTTTRSGSSLEPVTKVENPKSAVPPASMPTLISPRTDTHSSEPTEVFNQRQAQFRPPTAIDFNKRGNNPAPAMPASAGTPSDSPFQTPLMRQPTIREMPTRKF